MRDYSKEFADRVQYIRNLVEESGVDGIVFETPAARTPPLSAYCASLPARTPLV